MGVTVGEGHTPDRDNLLWLLLQQPGVRQWTCHWVVSVCVCWWVSVGGVSEWMSVGGVSEWMSVGGVNLVGVTWDDPPLSAPDTAATLQAFCTEYCC